MQADPRIGLTRSLPGHRPPGRAAVGRLPFAAFRNFLAARSLAVTAVSIAAGAVLLFATPAWSQAPAAGEQARVPTRYANVHGAPSSGSEPLVLVPQGTVLPIIGRRGEWVQVRLSPELRETGIVMRWYEGRHEFVRRGEVITVGDEDSGWMHDSTVEIIRAGAQ